MNLALGVIYAWSVFVAPFDADFGWTRTEVSVVFTIAILSVGSWFVVAGFLQDRFGPQKVAAFGGILYALGFFLASQTESLIWLYVTFGAIAGAGNGFGYAIPIPVCSKWFPDRRGLAVGLVVFGALALWVVWPVLINRNAGGPPAAGPPNPPANGAADASDPGPRPPDRPNPSPE